MRLDAITRAAAAVGTALFLSACVVAPDGSLVPATAGIYPAPGYYPPPPVYGPACDTSVQVVNRSRRIVTEFQFSPVQAEQWGGDRLGDGVLRPGQAVNFQPRYAGRYDFRATFSNGGSVEARNVDVCSASRVEVLSSSLRIR